MNWLLKARTLLNEDVQEILEEGFKEAKAKWGDESVTTIEQFRSLAKANQLQGNEKNIDWWVKNHSFEEFKSKVNEVTKKGSNTKQKRDASYTPHKDAKKIEGTSNYEVFYIPTYEASKFMGRFYKNKSTSWCVSTDELKYFNKVYRDSTFYFFIRKEFQGNDFDKIALQIRRMRVNSSLLGC